MYSLLVARSFGVSQSIAIYFAASSLYVSAQHVLQVGALTAIFVPKYHQIKQDLGRESAFAAFSVLANWILLVAGAVCSFGLIFSYPVVAWRIPGFQHSAIIEAHKMFLFILPIIFLDTASALAKCIVNAEKMFGLPELIHAITKSAQLVSAFFLIAHFEAWGLVYSLILAAVIRFTWLLVASFKSGYRHRLIFSSLEFHPRLLVSKLSLTWSYSMATQFYFFVFDAAISRISEDAFALVKHLQRLLKTTQSFLSRPASVVFFNSFSDAVSRKSQLAVQLIITALQQHLAFFCTVLIFAIVAIDNLLELMLSGETFSVHQVRKLSLFYVIGLPSILISFYGHVARGTTLALGKTTSLYLLMIVAQLISGVLAFWLGKSMTMGMVILMMFANAILLTIAPLVLLLASDRDKIRFYSPSFAAKWFVLGGFVIFTGLILEAFTENIGLQNWAVTLILIFLCSLTVLSGSYVLKISEITNLTNSLLRRFKRLSVG